MIIEDIIFMLKTVNQFQLHKSQLKHVTLICELILYNLHNTLKYYSNCLAHWIDGLQNLVETSK